MINIIIVVSFCAYSISIVLSGHANDHCFLGKLSLVFCIIIFTIRLLRLSNSQSCPVWFRTIATNQASLVSKPNFSPVSGVLSLCCKRRVKSATAVLKAMPPVENHNGAVETSEYDYDLIVVGGGSGGIAASKRAADLGARVAVFDFVKPTPIGTSWGLGGTCVNVGCVPKKLMHQGALLHNQIAEARSYGWKLTEDESHEWAALVEKIQNHIGSQSFGFRTTLREKGAKYINAYAAFVDEHTVKAVDRRGRETHYTADKFIIAVGMRPNYPDIPGAKEYAITSDDIFSLSYAPGKTVVVGASYISLECGGFLKGLGFDVTIMVRSILLRGFDQQCAEKVGEYMREEGVQFLRGYVPTKIEQLDPGKPEEGVAPKLKIEGRNAQTGETVQIECNTVLFAIGRTACTSSLNLEKIGVKVNPKTAKIIVDEGEKSSVENIYAIGDVIEGQLELTPVAIQAGQLLAERLYGGKSEFMDYINVPTTVFTPLEYGACGYSEEAARDKFGSENIEVYHNLFQPLEWVISGKQGVCYAKLVVKLSDQKVIGFHMIGPNAGEVTQGFALALRLGATKKDFDMLVGIHPTNAEVFTSLTITKSSGKELSASGCGGGS